MAATAASLGALAAANFLPAALARQAAPPAVPAVPEEVPVNNGSFERGLEGWAVPRDEGMTRVSTEAVRTGSHALKVTDEDGARGSDATSEPVSVGGARVIDLKGFVRPVSGSGLGVYVRLRDAAGKQIGGNEDFHRTLPSEPVGAWVPFSLAVITTPETAVIEIWLHSYGAAKVTAYLDDLVLVDRGAPSSARPWPAQYKIKPEEKGRLTAADVVGPDGIVYPDWTHAGVPGGIPRVAVRARAEEFGARPDDGKDDADALERAAESVGAKGGGVLLLAPGEYHLDRPISIRRDGVVLRGAGRGRTRLVFRYAGPKRGVGFFAPAPGATVGRGTWIEVHAAPKGLREIAIEAGGKVFAKTTYRPQHWGGTFSLRALGAKVLDAVPADGPARLRAVATYADGTVRTSDISVRLSRKASDGAPARVPAQIAAVMFTGISQPGAERKLAKDGRRGDTTLTLASASGLRRGDRNRLRAPATPRWNQMVRNACPWGEYRRYEFLVTGVSGNVVTLNQPLRLDFPVADGSSVATISPIRRCGVEDLTLAQTNEIWTSGIVFSDAWECWARGVAVEKAGRFPLYFVNAKWCEIRDSALNDAWYKGGGGTAYAGWEYASDCLMDRVQTRDLRHAPCVQWAASGNVIRRSTFVNSDGQWHSGWTNENLFEDCTIVSRNGKQNGGYGFGLWASPPEDEAHGPNGPRNVVYNCDVSSDKAGLWLGGMNEGWIVAYNRFTVASGPGLQVKTASFDHVVRDNVFVLADPTRPALLLATADCVGIEATGNRIFGGNGRLASGAASLAIDRGNTVAAQGSSERPRVPSIFEWQRRQKSLGSARATAAASARKRP